MQMSDSKGSKKAYDEDKYFNSQLFFFDNSKDKDSFDINERLSYDPNGTPQAKFKECLSKDLLEQIELESSLIISDKLDQEHTDCHAIEEDWTTDNSNKGDQCFNNYNRNNYPLKEKKAKNKKQKKKGLVERNGDWSCYFCKNLNFAFRQKCNRCFATKVKSDKSHDDCLKNVLTTINNNEEMRKSMFNI